MPPRTPRRSAGRRAHPAAPRTPRSGSGISVPATPSSGRGSDGLFVNGHWMCDCKPRLQAVLRETQKRGANKGRWFYTCPQERRKQCTFFLWEDYAGVLGGAGPSTAAGHSTVPRPTYRTSIGQRTTPPAERLGGPVRTAAPATAPRPAGMQQPLPPPPMAQSSGRQRIFRAALGGVQQDDIEMRDGDDESSSGDEAPPTPTPARTRRISTQSTAWPPRAAETSAAAPTTTPSFEAVQPPSNPITNYFGTVKKTGASTKAEEKQGQLSSTGQRAMSSSQMQLSSSAPTATSLPTPAPASVSAVVPTQRRGAFASDDSDSEFDSDMDRAMVALADAGELSSRRKDSSTVAETSVSVKEGSLSDGDMDMEAEIQAERARGIVVPVLSSTQRTASSSSSSRGATARRSRHQRRLLLASEDYAAKEAAAQGLSATGDRAAEDTATVGASTAAGTDPESSFASLFGAGRGQPQAVLQRPLPNFSFSSSAMASSQASTVASSQAANLTQSFETAATTPSASFRSSADDRVETTATDSATKRKRDGQDAEGAWYGSGTQGASSDEEGDVHGIVSAEDPFTTPSKRVRFRDMPVGADEGTEEAAGEASRHQAKDKGKAKEEEVVPSGHAPRKDHNVTLAVLQLLEGQPVEARVLQQVRALLNISFENHDA